MTVVFIGMETSGTFRRRFQSMGFETYSCDVLPAEDDGDGHIVGDVFEVLNALSEAGIWPKLAIFHIDCTYLTGSAEWAFKDPDFERYPGVGYHQKLKPGTLFGETRRNARADAIGTFRRVRALPIFRKVVENPVGALSREMKPGQILQPYECGDDASKKTCFWYLDEYGNETPEFVVKPDPELRFPGRWVGGKERWANQTDGGFNKLGDYPDRWKDRSRTYPGLADVTSKHWAAALLDALVI